MGLQLECPQSFMYNKLQDLLGCMMGSRFFAQIYLLELVLPLKMILFPEYKSSTQKFIFGTRPKEQQHPLPLFSIYVHLSSFPASFLTFPLSPKKLSLLYTYKLYITLSFSIHSLSLSFSLWENGSKAFHSFMKECVMKRAHLYCSSMIDASQLEFVCNSSDQIKQNRTGNIQNCSSPFFLSVCIQSLFTSSHRKQKTPLNAISITYYYTITYQH